MIDNTPWRRRNYFIKKRFQLQFISRFLFVAIAGLAAAGLLVYRYINRSVENQFYSSHIHVGGTSELILPALLKADIGITILVLAAVIAVVVAVSHRLAGPIFRLGKAAEKIGRGDLTGSFDLRTGDEIKSLSDSFRQMNGRLKEQFMDMKREASAIESYSKKMLEDGNVTKEEAEEFYRLSTVLGKRLDKFIA